jgi:dTDP-4-dehydrorhamnose reductase
LTLLITGADGQVGREVVSVARKKGIPHRGFAREDLDIRDAPMVRRIIGDRERSPGVLVNLAAFTSVDLAETEKEDAFGVNAEGVENLGLACAAYDVPLIHVSTDYVFGGGPQDFQETDPTGPVNAYGRSKVDGEVALRKALPKHLILRTSWVFGPRGKNFVGTMLRLAKEKAEVRVVADEIGCPTGAGDVAVTILRLAELAQQPDFRDWGTYHFCGRPAVSRAELARAIFGGIDSGQGGPSCTVKEVSSAEYGSAARRPSRSVLDCSKIRSTFGIQQPDWRVYLQKVLDGLVAGGE